MISLHVKGKDTPGYKSDVIQQFARDKLAAVNRAYDTYEKREDMWKQQ